MRNLRPITGKSIWSKMRQPLFALAKQGVSLLRFMVILFWAHLPYLRADRIRKSCRVSFAGLKHKRSVADLMKLPSDAGKILVTVVEILSCRTINFTRLLYPSRVCGLHGGEANGETAQIHPRRVGWLAVLFDGT